MRGFILALVVGCLAASGPAAAQNLLVNPDFDLTPVGNGWTAIGAGTVTHLVGFGQPAPSAQLDAEGGESMVLAQCRPVSDDTVYGVVARTYTSFASGASTNAVRVRWYGLEGCTSELGALEIDTTFFPPGEFARRYDHHAIPPTGTQSARVELEVVANGTPTQVFFDAIYLPEPGATALAFAAIAGLAARRHVR